MSNFAVLKMIKFSTKDSPLERGSQITYADFEKEIPELRRRERIIAQLIDQRRIAKIEKEDKVKEKPATLQIKNTGITHAGGAYFQLPNGEKFRGKKAALKRLEELRRN